MDEENIAIVSGVVIIASAVGYGIYELYNYLNKNPNLQYDIIASNPITKYIQAQAIKSQINNENTTALQKDLFNYPNAKVVYTNTAMTIQQYQAIENTLSNPIPIIDITPTSTNSYNPLPNSFPVSISTNQNPLGTYTNPYNALLGYQGNGIYANIGTLQIVVPISSQAQFNQLMNQYSTNQQLSASQFQSKYL